jgi:hypothetical protein
MKQTNKKMRKLAVDIEKIKVLDQRGLAAVVGGATYNCTASTNNTKTGHC